MTNKSILPPLALTILVFVAQGCSSQPASEAAATPPSTSTVAPLSKNGKAALTLAPAPSVSASSADADARVGSALKGK